MTDEHGNVAGSQAFASSALPEPIVVKAHSGSHEVSGTLGVPPLLPSLTPVPNAQHGWRIHLPNGQYVTSHHGQYGTLTIDPQTGDLHYHEQANVHTGPHGTATGLGPHEDRFEVALQGANQDEVVAHVNVQVLSRGPGNSGKLNIGTEVVDMTITPITHGVHPVAPAAVQHDVPDFSHDSSADISVTIDDHGIIIVEGDHQQTSEHPVSGAAIYLDALGISPASVAADAPKHQLPADIDIVMAEAEQVDMNHGDTSHLDLSDALTHHDNQQDLDQDDDLQHHHLDVLPDVDPNS